MKEVSKDLLPIFSVGDLVTVKENDSLIDTERLALIGKTGRVVSYQQTILTKEDLEWSGESTKGLADSYTEVLHQYMVVFPHIPEREIYFDGTDLIAFKME